MSKKKQNEKNKLSKEEEEEEEKSVISYSDAYNSVLLLLPLFLLESRASERAKR
jgi:hypothetical protein